MSSHSFFEPPPDDPRRLSLDAWERMFSIEREIVQAVIRAFDEAPENTSAELIALITERESAKDMLAERWKAAPLGIEIRPRSLIAPVLTSDGGMHSPKREGE